MQLTVDSGQLSVGWRVKKLAEICQIEKSQGIYANLPYVGMENIESSTARFIGSTEPQSVKSSTFKFSPNHILYGRLRPYLNKVLAPDFVGHCSTEIFPIKPSECLNRNFLLYWLLMDSTVKRINATCTGTRMPRANMTSVFEFDFPLPPLPEQKRIVAILDEAFEGIDRAIANTEQNLANASELFESYLNAIFTKKGEGWVEKKLGDIATFRNGLNFTKSSKGESIKIVGVKDFQNHVWIQEDQLDSVTIDAELKEIDILREGDILTVRSNGNKELIGRCVIAGELSQKNSHSGFTIRIRIESENIYPQFVVYSLKSRHIRKQLIESGGGISISSLNQQGLSLIILSFPNLVEQKTIVAKIDELAAETQRLETVYRQKLAALNELKQSILQKAFAGELTANTANQTPKAAQEVNAA